MAAATTIYDGGKGYPAGAVVWMPNRPSRG